MEIEEIPQKEKGSHRKKSDKRYNDLYKQEEKQAIHSTKKGLGKVARLQKMILLNIEINDQKIFEKCVIDFVCTLLQTNLVSLRLYT